MPLVKSQKFPSGQSELDRHVEKGAPNDPLPDGPGTQDWPAGHWNDCALPHWGWHTPFVQSRKAGQSWSVRHAALHWPAVVPGSALHTSPPPHGAPALEHVAPGGALSNGGPASMIIPASTLIPASTGPASTTPPSDPAGLDASPASCTGPDELPPVLPPLLAPALPSPPSEAAPELLAPDEPLGPEELPRPDELPPLPEPSPLDEPPPSPFPELLAPEPPLVDPLLLLFPPESSLPPLDPASEPAVASGPVPAGPASDPGPPFDWLPPQAASSESRRAVRPTARLAYRSCLRGQRRAITPGKREPSMFIERTSYTAALTDSGAFIRCHRASSPAARIRALGSPVRAGSEAP